MAIKLSYVLKCCPHFDPDSSGAWFADAAAAEDYNVLAKWGHMTRDFDEYATRLSNALNEIGPVSEREREREGHMTKAFLFVSDEVISESVVFEAWRCPCLALSVWLSHLFIVVGRFGVWSGGVGCVQKGQVSC